MSEKANEEVTDLREAVAGLVVAQRQNNDTMVSMMNRMETFEKSTMERFEELNRNTSRRFDKMTESSDKKFSAMGIRMDDDRRLTEQSMKTNWAPI